MSGESTKLSSRIASTPYASPSGGRNPNDLSVFCPAAEVTYFTHAFASEEFCEFAIGGQPEIPVELTMQGAKIHLVCGGYYRHQVTLIIFEHDALGQPITRNVGCLRAVRTVLGVLMRDRVVGHAFAG